MDRPDKDLAFMLQYENIAWYENGEVRILDRRCYPRTVAFVTCKSHREVAQAVTDMVTQSAGPYTAAAMGMALAAYECRDRTEAEQRAFLKDAAQCLSNARPTTAKRMAHITDLMQKAAETAWAGGQDVAEAIKTCAIETNNRRYQKIAKIATHLVRRFPDNGTILTQCFAETIVGMMLREAREKGKRLRIFCPETRPYFQGARLTATVCYEMGFDVTVITDNMPAFVMQNEHVDVFTSAADAITMDGYVINKVGTLQIAIAAKHFGIPYYVTGAPDQVHQSVKDVQIEMRDPRFTLEAMGVKTARDGVKGYYPAFDCTPPELIAGVVTDRGVYDAHHLSDYVRDGGNDAYEIVV